MRVLADAGVAVGVLVAPIIPVITEHEVESVLEAARGQARRSPATPSCACHGGEGPVPQWLAEYFPIARPT
jgi:hypothetical protein